MTTHIHVIDILYSCYMHSFIITVIERLTSSFLLNSSPKAATASPSLRPVFNRRTFNYTMHARLGHVIAVWLTGGGCDSMTSLLRHINTTPQIQLDTSWPSESDLRVIWAYRNKSRGRRERERMMEENRSERDRRGKEKKKKEREKDNVS